MLGCWKRPALDRARELRWVGGEIVWGSSTCCVQCERKGYIALSSLEVCHMSLFGWMFVLLWKLKG